MFLPPNPLKNNDVTKKQAHQGIGGLSVKETMRLARASALSTVFILLLNTLMPIDKAFAVGLIMIATLLLYFLSKKASRIAEKYRLPKK